MSYSGGPPASVNSAGIVDDSIVNADVNSAAAIATSKIDGLDSSLALKAPLASPTFTGTVTLGDGVNLAAGTTTGTKIGTATTQKLGFYNVAPVVQQASADQASVATTGATNVTPFGYTTAAQANAVVTLLNRVRLDLVTLGLIKGAA